MATCPYFLTPAQLWNMRPDPEGKCWCIHQPAWEAVSCPVNHNPELPALADIPTALPCTTNLAGRLVTLPCHANFGAFGDWLPLLGSWKVGRCRQQSLGKGKVSHWICSLNSKVRRCWLQGCRCKAVQSFRCSLHLMCMMVCILLQKCFGLLKPELPGVNQMKPDLCGRWQVF